MNSFIVLTKALLKNASAFRKAGDKKYGAGLLVGVLAILALIVSAAFMFLNVYDSLAAYHLDGAVLASILSATCIAMIVFGILYVISIYYFSDDIIQLITLPIPPQRILAAKFVIVSIYQYILEAIVLLPCIIAFGIKKASLSFWIFSILVYVVLPLIPTVVCSLISLLIMSFGKVFKNKDRLKFVSGILAFAAAIGINVLLQSFTSRSITPRSLADTGALMNKTAMLFPSNLLAINAIQSSSPMEGILQFALLLLVSAAAVYLFLLLGKAFYISGVVGLSQRSASGKKLSMEYYGKRIRPKSAVIALAMKDWKLLYRTPAYFLNCVLSAVLFPPLIVFILGFSMRELTIPASSSMMVSVCVIIVCFLCTINTISPTAISREGTDITVAKYIPVSSRGQITAKLLPGLVISSAEVLVVLLIAVFFFHFSAVDYAAILVLSLIANAAFNMLGLFFDILFPKLEWDDETVAVKNNLNGLLQMIAVILVLGLITFLMSVLKLDYVSGIIFLLCFMLVLLALSANLLFIKGSKSFSGSGVITVGRTKNKKDGRKIITALATVVLVSLVAVFIFKENSATTQVTITSSNVQVSAGVMDSSSFQTSQVKSIYLKDTLPKTSDRVGYQMGDTRRGMFTVEGLGRGHIYVENNRGPFLYVIMKDGSFTIFNYSDSTKTNQLYAKLKAGIPGIK